MLQNSSVFNHSFQALEKAIDISQKRQGVIASNISNLDTPGYTAREIDFQAALKKALESEGTMSGTPMTRTHAAHLGDELQGGVNVEIHDDPSGFDGINWVGVDQEMKKLMENKLVYQTAVEAMKRKLTIIKDTIRDGGR
jgi:flagellar basal-body rod protein FlgB